jgi:hypothetical protein
MPLRRTIWLAAGLVWRSGWPRPEEGDKGRGGGARGRVKQQEVKVEAVAMVLAPADPKEEARDLPPWSDFSLLSSGFGGAAHLEELRELCWWRRLEWVGRQKRAGRERLAVCLSRARRGAA